MASPAHSPLLESLCEATAQRKGCPVNIVVLGVSRESSVTLLKALVGEEKADAAAEFAKAKSHGRLSIKETCVGTINSARVFITHVCLPVLPAKEAGEGEGKGEGERGEGGSPGLESSFSLQNLRRHLQRHRPASAILYARSAGPVDQSELAFLAALETSLGASLWRNAVCATVTIPAPTAATVTPAEHVPVADPGYAEGSENGTGAEFLSEVAAAACTWDGTQDSTGAVSDSLALVVSNHLPFVPEPEPLAQRSPAPGRGCEHEQQLALDTQAAFGDLDLVSSNNLSLLSSQPVHDETGQALGTPLLADPGLPSEGVALATATATEAILAGAGTARDFPSALTTTAAAAGAPPVHQPQLVPAFASLSMAFAGPALYGPAGLARGGTSRVHQQSNPSAAPMWNTPGAPRGPSALQGLAPVRAPAVMAARTPGGSASASLSFRGANLSLPHAVSSFSPGSLVARGPAKFSAFPEYFRFPDRGHGFGAPANKPGLHRVVMVWFRNDLRVHDNEALSAANKDGAAVLPVYCFDPRDFGKSSSGFDRTGPFRAKFLLQCVSDLRTSLRARGNDLIVRVGRPEVELPKLARATGATALYAHSEVTREDCGLEQNVAAKLKVHEDGPSSPEVGANCTYFWGSTLYHVQDLPFKLDAMPCNYSNFLEAIKSLKVRCTLKMPQRLKLTPREGNVSPGAIPTLAQLGFGATSQNVVGIREPLKGGEGEALRKLKSFLAEAVALSPKPGAAGTPRNSTRSSSVAPCLLGASFSCKISPWLAMGCLSPRRMFEEMKKVGPSTSPAGADAGTATGVSLDWLMLELLWRDFFRLITKKQALSPKEAPAAAPVPA